MRFDQPFQVVTPTVDGDVLAMLARADHEFTAGTIHRLIGRHSLSGVRKTLGRLVDQGVVDATQRGHATTYHLNRDHLAAGPILDLSQTFSRFLDRTKAALSSFSHPPIFAALFGSAARGSMRPDSDIDLFLVRPTTLSGDARTQWDYNVATLTHEVNRWTGNDARELEMSEHEVRLGLSDQDPILASIQEEGIVLSGSDEFWRQDATHNALHV